jgi:CheY-like chemotaxis protein
MVLVKMINKLGITKDRIDVVENGLKALENVKEKGNFYYPVILMDINMPIMDGLESTEKIRKLGCNSQIIAISAHAMDSHKEDAKRVGVDYYLTKPVAFSDIKTCLSQFV